MEAKFTGGQFETMANMKESVCKKNDDGTLRWGCRVIPTDLGVGTYDKISEECDEAATLFLASPLLYEALEQQLAQWQLISNMVDDDETVDATIEASMQLINNALRAARGE